MTQLQRRLPATALAACMLGFVVSPLPFLALAARADLQPLAAATLTAVFVLSAGLLLVRLLSKPPTKPSNGIVIRLFELASWMAVTSILMFISGMHLMRGIERWGAVSLVFLSAAALCFPLLWVRRTAVEQRIASLPFVLVLSALCTVLALSGAMLFAYLTSPARFL